MPSEWGSDATGDFICQQTSIYTGLAGVQKTDFCHSLNYQAHSFGPGIAPAAEYYYSTEYMLQQAGITTPLQLTGDGEVAGAGTTWNIQYPDGGQVVTDTYGWTAGLQSLHQAEQKYSDNDPHDPSTWADRGMQNVGDYESGERTDSWSVAGPGANNDKIGDTGFEGGFAGNCGEGESWQYVTDPVERWECSGRVSNWLQTVVVPEIQGGNGEKTVGVIVMPYNFEQSTPDRITQNVPVEGHTDVDYSTLVSYREAQFNDLPEVETITDSEPVQQMTARCKPQDASGWSFERTVNINPDSTPVKPVAVWGKVDMPSEGEYDCEWWYIRDRIGETGTDQIISAGREPLDLSDSDGRNDKREALKALFKDKLEYNWVSDSYTSQEFQNMVTDWESSTSFFEKTW